MNQDQVTRICTIFDLGTPLAELQAVPGSLLHHTWLLTTTKGKFAVKQLNPAILCNPHIYQRYRETEQIAAAMAIAGIPAVAALQGSNGPVQDIDGITIMVYKWIEGNILSHGPAGSYHARQIGTIMGQIHTLHLQCPTLPLPDWKRFSDDDWDMLTFHAADRGTSWARQVRAALPKLSAWSKLYEEAGHKLDHSLVVSHRDLDQKHVIWQTDKTPQLIDWEAAGLINPTMELVGVALSWSGQTTCMPTEDTFAAVFEGYTSVGGVVQDAGIDALHGYMGIWLGWLLFHMRRSLGESISSEDERELSIQETTKTLAILRLVADHIEIWAEWVEKWRR